MWHPVLNFIDIPSLAYLLAGTGGILLVSGNHREFFRGIAALFAKQKVSPEESAGMAELFQFAARVNLCGGVIWTIVGLVNIFAYFEAGDLYFTNNLSVAALPLFYALVINTVFFLPSVHHFRSQLVQVASLDKLPICCEKTDLCE